MLMMLLQLLIQVSSGMGKERTDGKIHHQILMICHGVFVFQSLKIRMMYSCLSLHMCQIIWKDLECKTAKQSRLLLQSTRKNEFNSDGDLLNDSERQIYQSLIGSSMWAMIGTRIETAFAIEEPSNLVSKPCRKHVVGTKRVVCYVKFTKDYHLRYSRGRLGESLDLHGHCDSYWGCQDDGKSVTG